MPVFVNDLDTALAAYWNAYSFRENQAAYHEILLFGGKDGYPGTSKWRTVLVRWLRIAALRIEGSK